MAIVVKDSGTKVGVQWSIERVGHEDGTTTLEPVVHIVDSNKTLVSVRVSNIPQLVKDLLAGAKCAGQRIEEMDSNQLRAGESRNFGVRVGVVHERKVPNKTEG